MADTLDSPTPKPKKRLNKRFVMIAAAALLLLGGLYYFLYVFGKESTDDASIEAHVVPISPKVAGYVVHLLVDDNQLVKAGDVLLEIDPTDYRNRVAAAQGDLEAAKAKLETAGQSFETTKISAPSNLESAQSQVDAAQATWQKAANDLKRFQDLTDLARSRQQLDDAIAAEKNARAALEDAKARLRTAGTAPITIASAQANVHSLQAQAQKAEADLAQAQYDLQNTKVTAPMDGRVTQRGVEQGTYVQPGQQLLQLVGNDYWVVADFKETQLTRMQPGQAATIRIDAYPGTHYRGHVDSIQTGTGARFSAFPPENATGNFVKIVQRVPVKILFDERPDAALPIGPGMSVVPVVELR